MEYDDALGYYQEEPQPHYQPEPYYAPPPEQYQPPPEQYYEPAPQQYYEPPPEQYYAPEPPPEQYYAPPPQAYYEPEPQYSPQPEPQYQQQYSPEPTYQEPSYEPRGYEYQAPYQEPSYTPEPQYQPPAPVYQPPQYQAPPPPPEPTYTPPPPTYEPPAQQRYTPEPDYSQQEVGSTGSEPDYNSGSRYQYQAPVQERYEAEPAPQREQSFRPPTMQDREPAYSQPRQSYSEVMTDTGHVPQERSLGPVTQPTLNSSFRRGGRIDGIFSAPGAIGDDVREPGYQKINHGGVGPMKNTPAMNPSGNDFGWGSMFSTYAKEFGPYGGEMEEQSEPIPQFVPPAPIYQPPPPPMAPPSQLTRAGIPSFGRPGGRRGFGAAGPRTGGGQGQGSQPPQRNAPVPMFLPPAPMRGNRPRDIIAMLNNRIRGR